MINRIFNIKVVTMLLPFFFFIQSYSQTIIWSEDFESYPDGTQNAVKWTTSANNCDADGAPGTVGNNYWGTRTTLGDKEFCCEDIEGLTCCGNSQGQSDNIWISESINISGYSTISIFISIRAEGNMECATCGTGQDLFNAEYQIDGGTWTNFLSVCGLQNGDSQIGCVDVGTGNTLRIRVLLGNQADDEEYYFDDIFVYEDICSVVLPIELISFNGDHNYDTGMNELNWITASEANNDKFEIYSSIDGEYWEMIGEIKGAGNSTTEQVYRFKHRPTSSLTYYKIKQVDYNGLFKYTNIISISRQDDKVINVKYYDVLGKELQSEPETGLFIKIMEYQYRTEYLRIFKL